jgi:hypothetical protein
MSAQLRSAINTAESDDAAEADKRRRRLVGLKVLATRARQRGVPDCENAALREVRAAGVPPRKDGFANLRRLELLDPLLSRMKRKRPLYTLDLLLGSCGKVPNAVTCADVDAYVSGQQSAVELVRRSDIRLSFVELIAMGRATTNPSPKLRGGPRAPLPAPMATEMLALERFHDQQRSAPGTRNDSRYSMRRAAKWACSINPDEGFGEMLWNSDELCTAFAFWWALPKADSELRSENCMSKLFTFLKKLWRALGRPMPEIRDHVRRIGRTLRTSGDDYGEFDLLDLGSENPAPAPEHDSCEEQLRWYATETARLRAAGPTHRKLLIALQRERLMFLILYWVGVRRASLAGFRVDMLKKDPAGWWYFDWCVTKRVRKPKRPVVRTWRVGVTTFSEWFLPQGFMEALIEMYRDEGYDLEKYLETHDEQYVPWTAARNGTFGAHLDGTRIAPVWRGKRGHLTVNSVYRIAAFILRNRLGMERGGPHALRRRSIMDLDPLALTFPQSAERTQHLNAESRAPYRWGVERSVGHVLQKKSETEALPSAAAASPAVLPPAPTSNARPTAARPARPARLTLADLERQ